MRPRSMRVGIEVFNFRIVTGLSLASNADKPVKRSTLRYTRDGPDES